MTKDVEKNAASVKPAVDWTQPIEAVHKDGRVVAVEMVQDVSKNQQDKQPYRISPKLDGGHAFWFARDGSHPSASCWHIRNVAQPTARTAAGQLDRMEALVRRMAARNLISEVAVMNTEDFQEARAIVDALSPVVDPDEEEAQKLNNDSPYDLTGLDVAHAARNVRYIQATILAAIKRGRALASEGK